MTACRLLPARSRVLRSSILVSQLVTQNHCASVSILFQISFNTSVLWDAEEQAEASRRLQRNIAYLEDDDTPSQQAERPADDAPSVIARVNAASQKLLQDHLDPPRTAPAGALPFSLSS